MTWEKEAGAVVVRPLDQQSLFHVQLLHHIRSTQFGKGYGCMLHQVHEDCQRIGPSHGQSLCSR